MLPSTVYIHKHRIQTGVPKQGTKVPRDKKLQEWCTHHPEKQTICVCIVHAIGSYGADLDGCQVMGRVGFHEYSGCRKFQMAMPKKKEESIEVFNALNHNLRIMMIYITNVHVTYPHVLKIIQVGPRKSISIFLSH